MKKDKINHVALEEKEKGSGGNHGSGVSSPPHTEDAWHPQRPEVPVSTTESTNSSRQLDFIVNSCIYSEVTAVL